MPSGNIVVDTDLTCLSAFDGWSYDGILGLLEIYQLPIDVGDHSIAIPIPIEFIRQFATPANTAERLIVNAIVRGCMKLAEAEDRDVDSVLEPLKISDDERYVHLLNPQGPRDAFAEFDSGNHELIPPEDLSTSSIGLAMEAGLEVPAEIKGLEKCNDVLHAIVDAAWKRIKTRLAELDRATLIYDCYANHERLLIDSARWSRTSRAVIATHQDKLGAIRASHEVKGLRDMTQITSRILIEMAVCTCPLANGRHASQADIDYLCGQIVLLIGTASQSDAMRAGSCQPAIEISSIGEFKVGIDVAELMHAYLGAHFQQVHENAVTDYEELFKLRSPGTLSDIEVFGKQFVEAFQREYGIGPQALGNLGVTLTEDALGKKSLVIRVHHEEFEAVLKKSGLDAEQVKAIYKHFVLHPRANWECAEKPYRNKDWWPWRFRRRLSLMTRPIVSLGPDGVIYAPAFCEDSFRHVVMEAFTGGAETEYFHTRAMKEYIGSKNADRGLAFNRSVADRFAENGFSVVSELQMRTLGTPHHKASGDIDVLAWKNEIAYVCECKELNFARTLGEVSEQLSRFRGIGNDDLSKHIRRVEWVKANPISLERLTKPRVGEIRSLLVTSKTVPMQFATDFPVEVVTIDQLSGPKSTKL